MAQAGNNWDLEADVIIIGAGAAGLPAAIKAVDDGASVIVVEANYDVGGHAIISGGHMALGGGTSAQKKYNIPDSPDTVFSDLTDWSIVQPNGTPDFRYNDRAVMRAFADHCATAFEFLLANGVEFADKAPDNHGASTTGNSAPRENHAILEQRRGAGKPQCGQRHRRDPAAGGERAGQRRKVFAQLQNDQPDSRAIGGKKSRPCDRHHRAVQPAYHAGRDRRR